MSEEEQLMEKQVIGTILNVENNLVNVMENIQTNLANVISDVENNIENLLEKNKEKELNKQYTIKEENLLWTVKVYIDESTSPLLEDTYDGESVFIAKIFNEGKYKDKSGSYDLNGNQLSVIRTDLSPVADFYTYRNNEIQNVTITQVQEELSTGGLIFSTLGSGDFTKPNVYLFPDIVVDKKVSNDITSKLNIDTFGTAEFGEEEEVNGKSVRLITGKYYKFVEGESRHQSKILFGTKYERQD